VPLIRVFGTLPRDCVAITPPDVWLGVPPDISVGEQFTIEAGSASLASRSVPNSNAGVHVVDGRMSGVKTCTLRADSPRSAEVDGRFVVGVTYQDPGRQPVREVTDLMTRKTDVWNSYVVLRNANLAWQQSHRLRAVKALDATGSALTMIAASEGADRQPRRCQRGEVEVVSNRIAGNTSDGLKVWSSTYATIYDNDNDIGFGVGGQVLGNGIGVSVEDGNGLMVNNDIRNSVGADIAVASTARMMILSNFTWNNGGKGIDGDGVPGAPKLAVVQAKVRGLDRRWFVLTDAPSAVGIIRIYGNESCTAPNDDKGRHPIDTVINGSHGTSIVLSPKDRHDLQYDFCTVTFTVQEGGTADKPVGRTSEFSTCVAPHAYPDTSGTGVPDVIQTALGGDPASPHKVVLPSDDGHTATLAGARRTAGQRRPIGRA